MVKYTNLLICFLLRKPAEISFRSSQWGNRTGDLPLDPRPASSNPSALQRKTSVSEKGDGLDKKRRRLHRIPKATLKHVAIACFAPHCGPHLFIYATYVEVELEPNLDLTVCHPLQPTLVPRNHSFLVGIFICAA